MNKNERRVIENELVMRPTEEVGIDKEEKKERTWRDMRILWHSVSPHISSGYGKVTRYFMSGLLNRGFSGFVSAYYGIQPGGILNWKGIYILPVNKTGSDQLGFESAVEHYKKFRCDLGTFHCYDEKTELLTEDGWVGIDKIREDRRVATLNPKTLELEYQMPSFLYKAPYKGMMVKFLSKTVDLLVIPNHRIYGQLRGKKWNLIPAKDLIGKRIKMTKTAQWKGEETFDKDLLSLLGWYISEGSIQNKQIKIYQKKDEKKREEIFQLCKKLGLEPKLDKDGIRINSSHSGTILPLLKECGQHSYEKRIPRRFLKLKTDDLKILYISLMKGNGYIRKNSAQYATSSKELADNFQELLLKIGLSGDIQEVPEGVCFGYKTRKSFRINIKRKRLKPVMRPKEIRSQVSEMCKYRGRIWGVTVPNKIVCVRRNGKIVFSGNSDFWVSYQFAKKIPYSLCYCYDKETEVLTKSGWKNITKISKADQIATLSKQRLVYERPKEVLSFDYKGKMYKLKNRNIDLFVTGNHLLYTKLEGDFGYPNPWRLERADSVIGLRKKFKKDVKVKERRRKLGSRRNPKKILGFQKDLFIKLLGWYITEGSLWGNTICISQSRSSPYWKEISELLIQMKLQNKYYDSSKTYMFVHKRLSRYLRRNIGENSYEKKIPRRFLELPRQDLELLYSTLRKGDGERKRNRYATVSKRLADNVQELLFKLGKASNLNASGKLFRLEILKKGEVWDRHRKIGRGQKTIEELEDFSGKVYCVRVPSQIIYIRRNGKGVWCSNSPIDHEHYPDKWLEVLRAYKWVAVPSMHAKNELKKCGLETYFVPHGVDISVYHPLDKKLSREAFTLDKDKFIIGIVAANNDDETRKAWDANFLAVKYFFEANPDAVKDTILLVHTNPTNEKGRNLFELSEQIGIHNSIVWNDSYSASLLTLPETAMCKLYNCLDVFLLLSRREGFCIPVLEAQACGVPAILNDFSALSERNAFGKVGWLVRPAAYVYSPLNAITSIPDPYKGADAIAEAYNNESKRKLFAKRSLEYAKRQTWDIAIDKYFMPLLEKIGEEIPSFTTQTEAKKIAGN